VIVPRFGHSAVDRNTVKRRLRELARTELLPALPALSGLDVVVRALPSAYGAGFDELQAAIRQVLTQLPQGDSDARA
jgi:ribonuclease P protein component